MNPEAFRAVCAPPTEVTCERTAKTLETAGNLSYIEYNDHAGSMKAKDVSWREVIRQATGGTGTRLL